MQSAAHAGECLVFENPGSLEINLVKLLGVSVKESDDPIGFFGTGLKYAMAASLRLGGQMVIFTDGIRHEIGGNAITLRGKQFIQVTLNGEPLGFTTELGKQWEAWMVVRELYSNALDEGGQTYVAVEKSRSRSELASRTVIVIRGQEFLDVWGRRDKYFIDFQAEQPTVKTDYAEMFPARAGSTSVFYRGINVKDILRPTLYRYNITQNIVLTEDRTLKYDFQFREAVERSLITTDDRAYAYRSLTAKDVFYESELPFRDGHHDLELSDMFRLVCADLVQRMPANANKAALRFYQKRTNSVECLEPASLTKVQHQQMARATKFVRELGCYDLESFPVHVVRWLGEGIHGRAKDGIIHISIECFDKGTKYLASTLYEEYVHCKYGFEDESRGLQTYLFDRVISMGEEYITGEPL